jgi:hypothetical protein
VLTQPFHWEMQLATGVRCGCSGRVRREPPQPTTARPIPITEMATPDFKVSRIVVSRARRYPFVPSAYGVKPIRC